MAKQEHLRNPPIVEAVIDIRVVPKDGITTDIFSQLIESHREKFKIEPEEEFGIQVSLPSKTVNTIPSRRIGVRLGNEQTGVVAQLHLDGFTFSRLRNYTEWGSLKSEAKELWEAYKFVTMPTRITRIATRYINNLQLQMPIDNLNRFLTAPPSVPPNVPNALTHFKTEVILIDELVGCAAKISQQLHWIPNLPTASIILDIDVFEQKSRDVTDDSLWEKLDSMRDLKNKIFFESVTEETLNQYR